MAKAIITLQNFITYLTYRANGSPKKIIKIIHEFIIVKDQDDQWCTENNDKTIFLKQAPNNNISNERNGGDKNSKRLFLYFNYSNQYRIGFLSYLYRPFLIQYGRNFKLFSDNIIISTPYLFDHLLKFHPFAFSLSNLELIPEVVSSNKTPSLQEHLRNIIDYLGENHIRRTDLGLFDYKFYSRTLNEITYISKLFEEEAAAFNFTLDESYLVKIYVRGKIKELRGIYSKFLGDTTEAGVKQIFSIAHLNGRLGDLNFFDQEYDDAIVAYSDAIRPINNLDIKGMSIREFITLFRNKLKLGLCFERTSSYDEALAFYADCCQDAKRFLMFRISNSKKINDEDEAINVDDFKNESIYQTSSLNDLLQVITQGFLATIIVEEKMGMEGITIQKLNISLGNFFKMAVLVIPKTAGNYTSLVFANAFLLIGKLFYFKNTASNINCKDIPIVFNNFPQSFQERFKNLLKSYQDEQVQSNKSGIVKRKPTVALYMYLIGIFEIIESRYKDVISLNDILKEGNQNKLLIPLLERLEDFLNGGDQRFVGYHYKYIANFLSSIGDSLLSMCEIQGGKYRKLEISELFNFKEKKSNNKFDCSSVIRINDDHDLGVILKCYYLSGKFFLKYGRDVSCSYQYRKILYVLKTVILPPTAKEKNAGDIINRFISFITFTFVNPILEIASQNSGRTDRHIIKKMEKISQKMEEKKLSDLIKPEGSEKKEPDNKGTKKDNVSKSLLSFILANISNNPETKEAIIVLNYIKVKLGFIGKTGRIISSCNSLGTQYLRLVELEFYAKYIYVKYFEKFNNKKCKCIINMRDKVYENAAIEYLYSMLAMLRIQKIYGTDFLIGHSSFAYKHYLIALFLERFTITKEIQDGVELIIGKGSYVSFDAIYHFQMAKDLYNKNIQLHTAGKEYKKIISDMIYLEDDFSDNNYHFGAAINRYLMINGDFQQKIKYCEKRISKDKYYHSSTYMNIKSA